MTLKDSLINRYATKKFDPTQRLTSEQFEDIKALLRYSPSSVNLQPWHFIISDNQEGKARIAKGAEGNFSANYSKIMEASHVVLYCVKTDLSDDYLNKILEQEDADGRMLNDESKETVKNVRAFFADIHRKSNVQNDTREWMEKQVYLNMGVLLMGAATLGIDAVPIEGVDIEALNQEFDLPAQGLSAVGVVALGYRDHEDFNAKLPKSRFAEEDIISCV